jgi:hypothetical protein
MRIRIDRVQDVRPGSATVSFTSPLGIATARWIGTVPDEGACHDVELEVPGVLTWGSEISETTAGASISEEMGQVCLVGCIRSLSDDGVAAVQIGSDTVLVEMRGSHVAVPRKVVIRVSEIRLLDVNL